MPAPIDPIHYPNRIEDSQINLAFKHLIDALNPHIDQLSSTTAANSAAIAALPTLNEIRAALSLGGTNPLNVTGLFGILGMSQTAAKTGTHAQRLLTTPQPGTFFWETDRTVLYVGVQSGTNINWIFASGTMSAIFSARPTGLTANDTGFLLEVSDHRHLCRWDGSAWIILDNDAGTFIDAAVLLGTGYQLCDGSSTTYLSVSGADLAQTAFTTPDETITPNVYHKSTGAYTGVKNAAVAPTISGSTAAEAAHTHPVTSPTGAPSATTTVDNNGGGSTVAVGSDTHTHAITSPTGAGSSHLHAVGTLVVSATGEPLNLGVYRYFRR